jgi:hypothetical protein
MQVPQISRPDQIAAYLAQMQNSAPAAAPTQAPQAGALGNMFSSGYGKGSGGAVNPDDSSQYSQGWSGGYNR